MTALQPGLPTGHRPSEHCFVLAQSRWDRPKTNSCALPDRTKKVGSKYDRRSKGDTGRLRTEAVEVSKGDSDSQNWTLTGFLCTRCRQRSPG